MFYKLRLKHNNIMQICSIINPNYLLNELNPVFFWRKSARKQLMISNSEGPAGAAAEVSEG